MAAHTPTNGNRRKRPRSKARAQARLLLPPVPHDARSTIDSSVSQSTLQGEVVRLPWKSAADSAALASRRALVWTLRIEGLDVDTIAARLEITVDQVQRDMRIVGRAAAEYARGRADEARELELARLDELWRAWYAQGCVLVDAYAAPILLRIIELRMKLLRLDALPADDVPTDRPLAGLSDADLLARLETASSGAGDMRAEPISSSESAD